MRRHGSPQELERIRREAVALGAQGVEPERIAVALDRSVHSVRTWLSRARRGGVEAVASRNFRPDIANG